MDYVNEFLKECDEVLGRYSAYTDPSEKIGAMSCDILGLEQQVKYWKFLYVKTLKRKKLT